jgi:putative restriction endonuclease
MISVNYGTPWRREELILALYLYCQIPFAQARADNPEVIRLASLIGRTPSSVARKLGNLGAFDPQLAKRGITGLTHFSKADKEIWNEFASRWDDLIAASQRLLVEYQAERSQASVEAAPIISRPMGPTERQSLVFVRVHQAFFRRTVLSSYMSTCGICGIDLPQLLVASHIVSWKARKETRTDPQNGLCLCALHDKAFDRGLVTVSPTFQVLVSQNTLKSKSELIRITITDFEGKALRLPQRFPPKGSYLEWHQKHVFQA